MNAYVRLALAFCNACVQHRPFMQIDEEALWECSIENLRRLARAMRITLPKEGSRGERRRLVLILAMECANRSVADRELLGEERESWREKAIARRATQR